MSTNQKRIDAYDQLARDVTDRMTATGLRCPECGSTDTKDNNATEYRCRECDHRWGDDMGNRYGY